MTTGKITRIVRDRGFGFIKAEDSSEEIFFHRSALENGSFEELNEGATVEFESEPDPKQPNRSRAAKVRSS
jgi:cold shock protein